MKPMSTQKMKTHSKVQEILEKYGNYVYYDGDPRRDGISLEKAISAIKQELKKALPEKTKKEESLYWSGRNHCLDDVTRVIDEVFK